MKIVLIKINQRIRCNFRKIFNIVNRVPHRETTDVINLVLQIL